MLKVKTTDPKSNDKRSLELPKYIKDHGLDQETVAQCFGYHMEWFNRLIHRGLDDQDIKKVKKVVRDLAKKRDDNK